LLDSFGLSARVAHNRLLLAIVGSGPAVCGKARFRDSFVSGHDFSRADKPFNDLSSLADFSSAGDLLFDFFSSLSSCRDCFVSGHDFSRAAIDR
jgi:hypothetical protein